MEPSGAVLALAHDTTPLSAESALFEEMLAGWRRQQISRRLGASLIDQRERTLRRFQAFADGWPWGWRPEQLERWVAQGGWAHSTVRSYQGAIAAFCGYAIAPRYGWVGQCEQRVGARPTQICHADNTATHVADYEGRPERRPLFTLPHPAVAGVDGIAAERRDRALVGPHRRMRPTPLGHPALQLLGSPAPRPAVSERLEPAQRALALVDQRRAEPTTDLLSPPARQHLLEQRRLRRQRRGVVGQRQDSPRRLHSGLPSCRHWLPHRGGEGNATGCRILASGASAARHPRSAGVSTPCPPRRPTTRGPQSQ